MLFRSSGLTALVVKPLREPSFIQKTFFKLSELLVEQIVRLVDQAG